MQARLMNLLNIRSGEERNVALMLGHYFFMGAAMILAIASSMALFFEAWDITAMPYVYLSIAVVVSSIIAIFLKLSERTALAKLVAAFKIKSPDYGPHRRSLRQRVDEPCSEQ